MDLEGWSSRLKVFADATRVRLLALLEQEELTVAELSAITTLAQPRVSTHLARLKEAGIRLLVEPINTFDIPGFYLNRTAQAIALIEEVGSPNLWLQHDIYHMQRMEGELANTIARHLPKIAHMQIADNPGRNEPGTGEINYRFLFEHLDRIGYQGWIGCEYKPATTTAACLGWLKAHGLPRKKRSLKLWAKPGTKPPAWALGANKTRGACNSACAVRTIQPSALRSSVSTGLSSCSIAPAAAAARAKPRAYATGLSTPPHRSNQPPR